MNVPDIIGLEVVNDPPNESYTYVKETDAASYFVTFDKAGKFDSHEIDGKIYSY